MREPVKARKLKLSKDATPTDAFVEIGKSVAAQWFGNDAASCGGLEVEHVHQLRVVQRRLKTALKLFSEWMDDTWTTRIAPDHGSATCWAMPATGMSSPTPRLPPTRHPMTCSTRPRGDRRKAPPADTNRAAARQRLRDATALRSAGAVVCRVIQHARSASGPGGPDAGHVCAEVHHEALSEDRACTGSHHA